MLEYGSNWRHTPGVNRPQDWKVLQGRRKASHRWCFNPQAFGLFLISSPFKYERPIPWSEEQLFSQWMEHTTLSERHRWFVHDPLFGGDFEFDWDSCEGQFDLWSAYHGPFNHKFVPQSMLYHIVEEENQ